MEDYTLDDLITFLQEVRQDVGGDASVNFEVNDRRYKLPTHNGKPFLPYAARCASLNLTDKGNLRIKLK